MFNCPTSYDFKKYIQVTETELMKLAARGISVLVASGDDGSPGFASNWPMNTSRPIGMEGIGCSDVASSDCLCGQLLGKYHRNILRKFLAL